jgi:hypothetical protein
MPKGKPGSGVDNKITTGMWHHGRRDLSYLKPRKFQNHVTIIELSRIVERDISRLRQLEREGRIPEAARIKRGTLEIRLWSPAQVEEIKEIIGNMRPGRPRR